jgi:hypothetical protein
MAATFTNSFNYPLVLGKLPFFSTYPGSAMPNVLRRINSAGSFDATAMKG